MNGIVPDPDHAALIMLLKGTPEQKQQALEYIGIKADPLETMVSHISQLKGMIAKLIETEGVYRVDNNGPDGWVCPWCFKLDEHKEDCLKYEAARMIGEK